MIKPSRTTRDWIYLFYIYGLNHFTIIGSLFSVIKMANKNRKKREQ